MMMMMTYKPEASGWGGGCRRENTNILFLALGKAQS